MKITFEGTIDEAVDAQIRLFEKTKSARAWKLQGLVFVPLIFVAVFLTSPEDSTAFKLFYATGLAVFFMPIYLIIYNRSLKRRTKKLILEFFGTDLKALTEYEFDDVGIVFRRAGTEIRFNWDKITEINENDNDLEFFAGDGGLVLIPKRAFANDEQKDECLRFAREKTIHLQQEVQV